MARPHTYDGVPSDALYDVETRAENDCLPIGKAMSYEPKIPPPHAPDIGLPLARPSMPPELVVELLEEPFQEREQRLIASEHKEMLDPGNLYYAEAKFEEARADKYRWNNPMLRGRNGERRLGVIIRHLVKRRWESLGIWNPAWGFPGRNVQPNDNANRWKWRWEPHRAGPKAIAAARQAVIHDAVLLRDDLSRSEPPVLSPYSRLTPDTAALAAEGFITSRPWFVDHLERAEETTRCLRLGGDEGWGLLNSVDDRVDIWWQDRGDWRDKDICWKWRCESPSPEPEDLTVLGRESDNLLEMEGMEFTPSEIGELEAIELPAEKQPEKYWTVMEGDTPPVFPGQRVGRQRAQLHLKQFHPSKCSHPFPDLEAVRERERARALWQKKYVDPALQSNENEKTPLPPSPPRRSARIAAMKRAAESTPLETPPSKKPRITAKIVPKVSSASKRAKPKPTPAREKREEAEDSGSGRGRKGRK